MMSIGNKIKVSDVLEILNTIGIGLLFFGILYFLMENMLR